MNQTETFSSTAGYKKEQISIAMCTYNGEKYLEQQLASIADQLLLPNELIICDDGSVDGTLAIAEEFATKAPFRVSVVRNPTNLGYSRNFAKAIQLCSGDLIALSDQDDIWHPNKLARLAELFKTENCSPDGIFSNGDLIDSDSNLVQGELWASFSFERTDQVRFRAGSAVEVLLRRNVVTGMTLAFRSSWKDQLQNMPESWHHDAWLALMMASNGKLLACPEHLVAYRIHDSQQVGVPITLRQKINYLRTSGIRAYLQLSRDRNLREYKETAMQFENLLASFSHGTTEADQKLLPKLQAKVEHARRAYAALSIGRLRRWPTVLLNKKNYQSFSPTGARAMLRDLLL
jgi:glycosyltransferase involved in cell wall biosynthesis